MAKPRDDDSTARLGQRLRELRENLGLSIEELETRTEAFKHLPDFKPLHASTIDRAERGDTVPTRKTVKVLAKALDADEQELVVLWRAAKQATKAKQATEPGESDFRDAPAGVAPLSPTSSPLPLGSSERLGFERPLPTNLNSPLMRMRNHGRTAREDADHVHAGRTLDASDAVTLADVYVERAIEGQLVTSLIDPSGPHTPILVVGEAGVGKTSLLWSIARRLDKIPNIDPWLVKASVLRDLDQELLAEAIAASQAEQMRPILLLDTVDLLLHGEGHREHLLAHLSLAESSNCKVVMTCRAREATQWLPKRYRKNATLPLGNYAKEELQAALHNYVQHFHAHETPRTRAQFCEKLAARVEEDYWMGEICKHPLTLRMLFVLYASDQIPITIDATKLYEEYWERRVRTDQRAGEIAPVSGAPDLAPAAEWLALKMLADGGTTLATARARDLLRRKDLPVGHIDGLISRGICAESDDETLDFFHQTFFEHAAARGMISRLNNKGLLMLDYRREPKRAHGSRDDSPGAQSNNLLVTAVLEHALLIASSGSQLLRSTADQVLARFLDSSDVTHRSAAIAAYARLRVAPAASVRHASQALTDTKVADRFIGLVPSVPAARKVELFDHLVEIWSRAIGEPKGWKNCFHILEQLPHLARRSDYAQHVRAFLVSQHILEAVLAHQHHSLGSVSLAALLEALAPRDQHCWDDFMELCRSAGARNSAEFLATVLPALTSVAEHMQHPHVAGDALAHIRLRDSPVVVNRAMGPLWAAEWRLLGQSLDEILDQISRTSERTLFLYRLNGLTEVLRRGTERDTSLAWSVFLAEREQIRVADWVAATWSELLDITGIGPDAAVLQFLGERIAAILSSASGSVDPLRRERFMTVVREKGLPAAVASPLLRAPLAGSPEAWLDIDSLAYLLPFGCLYGHRPARTAMQRVLDDLSVAGDGPAPALENIARLALEALAHHVARSGSEPPAATLLLRLAIMLGSRNRIIEVLESQRFSSGWFPAELTDRLRELGWQGMAGDSVTQAESARLLLLAIRQGLIPELDLDEAGAIIQCISTNREHMQSRFSEHRRKALLDATALLSGTAVGPAAHSAIPELIRVAQADEKDIPLRESALEALSAIVRREGIVVEWALQLAKLVSAPPTNKGLVYHAWKLLDDLLPVHVDIAQELIRLLLERSELSGRSHSGFRGSLHPQLRAFMSFARSEQRLEILELARTLHPKLGAMIVEAACHAAYGSVEETLEQMRRDPNVNSDIKLLIKRQQDFRRGELGASWPELARKLDL
ncbi:MAG: helix-turn-helix domain-containing protein [Deltaproteobacteria bacterium]|nr:helix-turn-helix domain-containing protein [Deltaproteobacteria bacterium]